MITGNSSLDLPEFFITLKNTKTYGYSQDAKQKGSGSPHSGNLGMFLFCSEPFVYYILEYKNVLTILTVAYEMNWCFCFDYQAFISDCSVK